jgi:hypothetical protein
VTNQRHNCPTLGDERRQFDRKKRTQSDVLEVMGFTAFTVADAMPGQTRTRTACACACASPGLHVLGGRVATNLTSGSIVVFIFNFNFNFNFVFDDLFRCNDHMVR